MAEAFAFAEKHGTSRALVAEVLITSIPLIANAYRGYGAAIVGGTFSPPGFGLRLGSKDARLVLEAAGQVTVLMPAANLVRDRLTAAINRGSWRIGLVGAGDRGVRGRRFGLTGIREQRCVVSAGF